MKRIMFLIFTLLLLTLNSCVNKQLVELQKQELQLKKEYEDRGAIFIHSHSLLSYELLTNSSNALKDMELLYLSGQ